MLSEKGDGKMAKHNALCSNGGEKHTFDEYGLCFECGMHDDKHDSNCKAKSHFAELFLSHDVYFDEVNTIENAESIVFRHAVELVQGDVKIIIGIGEKK